RYLRFYHVLAQRLELVDPVAYSGTITAARSTERACIHHHSYGLWKFLPRKRSFGRLRRHIGRICPASAFQCIPRRDRRERIGGNEMLRSYFGNGVDLVAHTFRVAVPGLLQI